MKPGTSDWLAALRQDYAGEPFPESDLDPDPFAQFGRWLLAAAEAGTREPNAVVLATAAGDGAPSARTVLLKAYDDRGFVVATSYRSRKGREAAANPRASLVFPWIDLARQVVVVGTVERASPEESSAYFATRPRGAQLAAWASEQSSVLASRSVLDSRLAEVVARFPDGTPVPRPDHWGGLRVVPETVEFWQGRADRLHDRLQYRRTSSAWVVERLSP